MGHFFLLFSRLRFIEQDETLTRSKTEEEQKKAFRDERKDTRNDFRFSLLLLNNQLKDVMQLNSGDIDQTRTIFENQQKKENVEFEFDFQIRSDKR